MSVKSTVSIKLAMSGELTGQQAFATTENTAAAGDIDIKSLATGFNTIPVPLAGGASAPRGVIIVPPSGNVATITLKGVTGDTGVLLHPTDPTYISLASTVTTFGLTVSSTINGVRLLWN